MIKPVGLEIFDRKPMQHLTPFLPSRRMVIGGAAAALTALVANPAWAIRSETSIKPALLRRAMAAFDRHRGQLSAQDMFAVVDFSAASREPRFHLVDVLTGATSSLLVAHGRGSDPEHSGWLERFSNEPGSAASSSGAYLTADIYQGKHGRSRRLIGLDPENSNVEARAVVIHAAWYVGPEMVRDHGKLGRSEGCFAFSENDLPRVLERLGSGRMIYADKV